MGRGSGSGGRNPNGPGGRFRPGERFVDVKDLASVPIEGPGVQEVRVERQMKLLREGKANQNVVKISVDPDGKASIDDGRHRIIAARRLAEMGVDVKLRVRFSRGRRVPD